MNFKKNMLYYKCKVGRKMKRKLLLILLVLVNFMFITNIKAATTCTYTQGKSKNGVKVTLDDLGNISYEAFGYGTTTEFNGLTTEELLTYNFANGNIDVLYGTVANGYGENNKIIYSLSRSGSSNQFYLDSCTKTHTTAEQNSNRKAVLSCSYSDYQLTVNFFNDKTAEATTAQTGYRVVNNPLKIDTIPEKCPSNIYTQVYDNEINFALKKYTGYSSTKYNGVNSSVPYVNDDVGFSGNVTMDNVAGLDFCSQDGVRQVLHIVGYIVFFTKIIVPLILIIMGSVDFITALKDPDGKSLKDQLFQFGKRLIGAAIIFFIPTIVNFVFSLVDNASEYNTQFSGCTDCVLKPFNGTCTYQKMGEGE